METLRILISSPGDVEEERERARQVIESLRRRYAGCFYLKPLLWEDLPLQADMSFQDGIDLVLSAEHGIDVAVFVLWSRMGVLQDGGSHRSGTEREFELMRAARAHSGGRRPALLVYTRADEVSFEERLRGKSNAEKLDLLQQKATVEQFIAETFQDASTGKNLRAYHQFDRPVTFSQRLRTHLVELLDELAGGAVQDVVWDTAIKGPPFMGLETFQPEHADVFFGREEEILEARYALRKQACAGCAFLMLSGASGSGKSSLARAGLLPAIMEHEVDEQVGSWRSIILTPTELAPDPVGVFTGRLVADEVLPELCVKDAEALETITQGLREHPALTFDLRIKDALARASYRPGLGLSQKGGVRLVVLVDQLEEFYASAAISEADRTLFFGMLEALARSGRVWVVATVRSDYSGPVQKEKALVRMKSAGGQLDVLAPGADALRRIIEEPARLAGLSFEEREGRSLVRGVIEDVAADAELLPLVEFVLRELYERRTATGQMTYAAYETLGGVHGALSQRAEAAYWQLSAEAQASLKGVLQKLVTLGGEGSGGVEGERAVRQWPTMDLFPDGSTARQLVDRFVAERLFMTVQDRNTGGAVVTVAHESLLRVWSRAVVWAQENADFLRTRARIVSRMKEGSLLLEGDPLLAAAVPYLTTDPEGFTLEQRTFIEKSQHNVQAGITRRERLRQRVNVALTCLALASFIAAGWAWSKQLEATEKPKFAQVATQRAEKGEAAAQEQSALATKRLKESARTDWVIAKELLEEGRERDAFAYLARACENDPESTWATETAILALNDWRSPPPLATLQGHGSRVTSAQFSADGRRVVTASADGMVRVWEVEGGKVVSTLQQYGALVISAQFSADGRRVVTASSDNTVRVWEVEEGKAVSTLRGHGGELMSAQFSADGRRVVTASSDNTVRVWEVEGGKVVSALQGHDYGVASVRFSADGRRVVTVSRGKTARVWEVEGGKVISSLQGHGREIVSAQFSADGHRVVTACEDKTARVWEVESGKVVSTLQGHGSEVMSAQFSADGRRVVTASEDKTARVWEVESGEVVSTLLGHEDGVMNAQFSWSGRQVVTVSRDKTARVWEVESGKVVSSLQGHGGGVMSAQFSADGRRVVTASEDKTVRVWEVEGGKVVSTLQGHEYGVVSARFSEDGRRVVTVSRDETARVWEVECGKVISTLQAHGSEMISAQFSADGRRVVTASADGTARVWEVESGKVVSILQGHGGGVMSAQFSWHGRRVVTASLDGTARVWEVESGKVVSSLKGHGGGVWSAQFSADGSRVVTASLDRTAWVWEVESGRMVSSLKGHGGEVMSAQFSTDGSRVVTASSDKTARVWEVEGGKIVSTLEGHGGGVTSAQFSADGLRVVTASSDNTVRVWEVEAGKVVSTLRGHGGEVMSAQFSADGRRVVTASSDKTARVWEVEDGKVISTLHGHTGGVMSAQFSADGQRVVTASLDETARVWEGPGRVDRAPLFWPLFLRWLSRLHLNDDGEPADLSLLELQQLREKLNEALPEDNSHSADIVRWFLARPEERPVRPGSSRLGRKVADSLVTPEAPWGDLLRAQELDGGNPLVHLALARYEQDARAAFLRDYSLSQLASASASQKARAAALLISQKDQADRVLSVAEAATKAEPGNATALRAQGKALDKLGRSEDALAVSLRLLDLPEAVAEDFTDAGYRAAELRKADVTRAIFSRAVARFPNDYDVHFYRGWALINIGDSPEALVSFQAAHTLATESSRPSERLLQGFAIAYWLCGALDDAVKSYRRLIETTTFYDWTTAETIANFDWPIAEKVPLEAVRAETLKRHPELAPPPQE